LKDAPVIEIDYGTTQEYKKQHVFLEAGLELGETLKIGSPESVRRYATRQDGSHYGSHLEKVFEQRREAAVKAMDDAGRQQTAATSGYWLAELTVPSDLPKIALTRPTASSAYDGRS
jgi:hypothetical protein